MTGPIIDRDPGDEHSETYTAMYAIDGFVFTRFFEADDLDHAQEQALDAIAYEETLLEVNPLPRRQPCTPA